MRELALAAAVIEELAPGAQERPFLGELPVASDAKSELRRRVGLPLRLGHAVAGRLAGQAIDHAPFGHDVAMVLSPFFVARGAGTGGFSLPVRDVNVSGV